MQETDDGQVQITNTEDAMFLAVDLRAVRGTLATPSGRELDVAFLVVTALDPDHIDEPPIKFFIVVGGEHAGLVARDLNAIVPELPGITDQVPDAPEQETDSK